MRISSDIRVHYDEPWLQRLREEGRLAPFNRLMSAINSSLSGQRYEIICAEGAMMKWGGFACVSAALAATIYFSAGYMEGRAEVTVFLLLAALACAFNWARARERRMAYRSEAALMEGYLVDAGFKLTCERAGNNSKRPMVVTLEWPNA